MTPIDYIRIDVEILSLKISDKAKLLLGLIKRFSNKSLMMSNSEIGALLNCSGDNIRRLLKETEKFTRIENPQSRYRKIFYSNPNAGVEPDLLEPKCTSTKDSTRENEHATRENEHAYSNANARHNIKNINNTSSSFVEYWNSKGNLREILKFSDQRKTKLKTRMAERLFADNWRQVIDKISASRFCTGHNGRKWKADIDWILKNSTNYTKALEGKYDNNEGDIDFETTEEEAEALMAEIGK